VPPIASFSTGLLHDGEAPGPTVVVDPDRIVEALMNLLDNALRHTPPGGHVTVTVDRAGTGRAARVSVADTGEGFPPADAARLFERFYRADPARGRPHDPAPGRHGSGIGLTITRAIVQAHHGSVVAHSAGAGQGATFTVTLPAGE